MNLRVDYFELHTYKLAFDTLRMKTIIIEQNLMDLSKFVDFWKVAVSNAHISLDFIHLCDRIALGDDNKV